MLTFAAFYQGGHDAHPIIRAITPHGDPSAPVTAVEPRSRRVCACYGLRPMNAHFSSVRIDGGELRTQLMGDKEASDIDELLEFDPRSAFNFMKHPTRQFGTKGIWGINETLTSHYGHGLVFDRRKWVIVFYSMCCMWWDNFCYRAIGVIQDRCGPQ